MTQTFKQNWDEFCDELKSIGDIVSRQDNLTNTDEVEGYRYLTRLLRLSLEMNIEHSDRYHPSFYSLSHETAKIGADNPDNIYLNANIDGSSAADVTINFMDTDPLGAAADRSGLGLWVAMVHMDETSTITNTIYIFALYGR